MSEQISFVERVRRVITDVAAEYESYFVRYDYLLCSLEFEKAPYYVISAHGDNFQHLTGVQSNLKSTDFYKLARTGLLSEENISFVKSGTTPEQVKGTVRRKIKVLPNIIGIFSPETMVEEDFERNRIKCSLAIGKEKLTLGFSASSPAKPMTLLEGNLLDESRKKKLNLVLRKNKNDILFDDVVFGDLKTVVEKVPTVIEILSEDLKTKV